MDSGENFYVAADGNFVVPNDSLQPMPELIPTNPTLLTAQATTDFMGGGAEVAPGAGGIQTATVLQTVPATVIQAAPATIIVHPTSTTTTSVVHVEQTTPPVKKRAAKKKKDPNAPHAPCSAYTLFFRDTQATVKSHNPVSVLQLQGYRNVIFVTARSTGAPD